MPRINPPHYSRILTLSYFVLRGSVAESIHRYENTNFTNLKYEILGTIKCAGHRICEIVKVSADKEFANQK